MDPETSKPSRDQLARLVLRQRQKHHEKALEADRRVARLDEMRRGAEARAAEMEADVARLRAELDAVYRSSSWRITAPLRWLRQLFG